MVDYNPEGTI